MNRNRPILWINNFLLFTIALIMAAENDNIAKDDPNIVILNEMLSHMDESVEPCLNFQNYSAKNIHQMRPPPFIAKFQILFDELKDKVFEEGSLEVKMQRLYNICLADNGYTNKYPPEEARTLQQVEHILGRSLSKYLEYFYGHSFPKKAEVYVMSWRDLKKIRTFGSDVEPSNEIKSILQISLAFPIIEKVDRCVKSVCLYLNIAANVLYEERFLGPKNVSQYQSQAKKIFEAVRHQFNIRLERNSLNWTASEISVLQESLNGLTLSIGNIPEKVNHRDFATEFYKDLDFSVDDSYDYVLLKASEYRRLKRVNQLEQSWGMVYRRDNIIVVPYNIMEDSAFELETHDIFRMAELGTQIAFSILDFFRPEACNKHSDSVMKMFDDHQICTDNLYCPRKTQREDILALQQAIIITANLVHEAYFATGSEFNQTQPSFTTKTLSQLSFLKLAQSVTKQVFVKNELLNHLWPKLPSFAQSFNCAV